jgi:hypothetical protein
MVFPRCPERRLGDITCNASRRRGTTTHAYDLWTVDELQNHACPAGRVHDTK